MNCLRKNSGPKGNLQPNKVKAWLEKHRLRMYETFLIRNILEQSVPSWYICINMALFFLINTILIISTLSKAKRTPEQARKSQQSIIQINSIFGGYMIANLLLVVCLWQRPTNSDVKELVLTSISIYMTIAFTYIVYPMMAWMFFFWVAKSTFDQSYMLPLEGSQAALFTIFFLVGTAFAFLTIAFRNDVMSRSKLSMAFKGSELLAYFTVALCAFWIYLARSSKNAVWITTISLVTIMIRFYALWYMISRRPFWDMFLNDYYVCGYALLLLVHIAFDILPAAYRFFAILCLLILGPMILKIVKGLNDRNVKINIFDASVPIEKLYLGMMTCETLLCELSDHVPKGRLQNLFVHYFSLWHRQYDSIYGRDPSMTLSHQSFRGVMHSMFLRQLDKYDPLDPLVAKTTLLFAMLGEKNNLRYLRAGLARASYSLQKVKFGESFDHFHFRKLYENKLDALYKGKIKDFGTAMSTISNIYEDLQVLRFDDSSQESLVDLMFPVREFKRYTHLVSSITKELEADQRVFNRLSIPRQATVQEIFALNTSCLRTKQATADIVEEFEYDIRNHATYCYPMLIYYFSLIRNSYKKAEMLFQVYKRRLVSLVLSMADNQIHTESVQLNSVTIVVDLEEERSGQIMMISPNYFQFIGMPPDKRVLGRDCSDLLPSFMAEAHKKLVTNFSYKQVDWFHHRDILFLGFDNFLRKGRITLRVVPDIKESICAVALIEFGSRQNECLLLLEGDGVIYNAEQVFWDLVDSINSRVYLKHMRQICPDLCAAINLCRARRDGTLAAVLQGMKTGDKAGFKILKEAWGMTDDLLRLSKTHGLKFNVSRDSQFYHPSKCRVLNCQFEFFKLFGREFVKVFIRIDGDSYLVADRSESSNAKKNGLRTTNSKINDSLNISDESEDLKSLVSSKGTFRNIQQNNQRDHFTRFSSLQGLSYQPYSELVLPVYQSLARANQTTRSFLENIWKTQPSLYRMMEDWRTSGERLRIEEFDGLKQSYSTPNTATRRMKNTTPAPPPRRKRLPSDTLKVSDIESLNMSQVLQRRGSSINIESPERETTGMFTTTLQAGETSKLKDTKHSNGISTYKSASQRQIFPNNRVNKLHLKPKVGNLPHADLCTAVETRSSIKFIQASMKREEDVCITTRYNVNRVLRELTLNHSVIPHNSTAEIPQNDGSSEESKADNESSVQQVVPQYLRNMNFNPRKVHMIKDFYKLTIASIVSLMLLEIFCVVLQDRLKSKLDSDLELLEVSSLFLRVQSNFEMSLYKLTSNHIATSYRFSSSIWKNLYPERNITEAFNVEAVVPLLTGTVLNTTAMVIYGRLRNFTFEVWTDVLNEFLERLEVLQKIPEIYNLISEEKITLETYDMQSNWQKMNLLSSFRIVQAIAWYSREFIVKIEDAIAGQKPPYNMSRDIENTLIPNNFVEVSETIYNGLRYLQPQANKVLDLLISPMDDGDYSIIWVPIALIILLWIAISWWIVYLVAKLRAKLQEILTAYQFLKPEDQVYMHTCLGKHLKDMKEHVYNEIKLVRLYKHARHCHNNLSIGKITEAKIKLTVPATLIVKSNRVKFLGALKATIGVVTAVYLSCMLATIVICISVMVSQKSSYQKSVGLRQFYLSYHKYLIQFYGKMTKMSTFVAFGNYMALDGVLPEDYLKPSSEVNGLNDLWSSNQIELKDYLGQTDYDSLARFVFKDGCAVLPAPRTGPGWDSINTVCNQFEVTKKGILGFWIYSNEFFDNTRRTMMEQYQGYLNKTKTQFFLLDGVGVFLESNFMKVRLTNDLLLLYFNRYFFVLFERKSDESFNIAARRLRDAMWAVTLLLLFALLFFFFTSWTVIRYELMVCNQTFAVITPEIIRTNAMLGSIFKRSYLIL